MNTLNDKINIEDVENDRIEKLGVYFVHFDIREKYGITFEQFIKLVDSGAWAEFQDAGKR